MTVVHWPNFPGDKNHQEGPVDRLLHSLKEEKNIKLFNLTVETLEDIGGYSSLKWLYDDEWARPLVGKGEPLEELRIPPQGDRRGVVRIYFAYHPDDPELIVLLDCEVKKGKGSDRAKIQEAKKRYKEMFDE